MKQISAMNLTGYIRIYSHPPQGRKRFIIIGQMKLFYDFKNLRALNLGCKVHCNVVCFYDDGF